MAVEARRQYFNGRWEPNELGSDPSARGVDMAVVLDAELPGLLTNVRYTSLSGGRTSLEYIVFQLVGKPEFYFVIYYAGLMRIGRSREPFDVRVYDADPTGEIKESEPLFYFGRPVEEFKSEPTYMIRNVRNFTYLAEVTHETLERQMQLQEEEKKLAKKVEQEMQTSCILL